MPTFNRPELAKEISESYWSKREIMARKLKTGVSQAIKDVTATYKAVNWKSFAAADITIADVPNVMGTFEACKTAGVLLKRIKGSFFDLMKETKSGPLAELRTKSYALRDKAEKAAAEFKKAKYPKGEQIARDIAKAADFLGVSVNQNSLSNYLSAIYKNLFTQVNNKIGPIVTRGSITQNAKALYAKLVPISREDDLTERAKQLNALVNDGSSVGAPRSLTQTIGMRMKAAYCGCDYPALAAAEAVFKPLSKWANSPPKITANNVTEVMKELLKLSMAAQKLPDNVKLMPVTP